MFGTGSSSFGDGMQAIAASWFLLKSTGSPLAIGGMIAVTHLPSLLFAPFAGAFSDTKDAKRMVVIVDILRFIIVGLMAFIFVMDIFSLWIFYVLQFTLAVANMFYKPASQILVKETFTVDQIVTILSISSSLNMTTTLIGSAFGGWMVTVFPPSFSFFVNAFTFLVSSLCNSNIHRIQRRSITRTTIDFLLRIKESWDFISRKAGMLYILFLSIISSFSLQLTNTLLAPYVDRYFGGSGMMFAILDICFTLGGVVSGMIVSTMLQRFGPRVVIISMIGMGAFSALAGFRESFFLVALSITGLGFFTMFHLVTMQTLIQVNTPKEILGSVIGLRSIVASMTKISASLGGGLALNLVDIKYVYWGFAVFVLLAMLTSSKVKTIQISKSIYTPKENKGLVK
jgi:DHA3 family macrolide efflux protein-like MFS transporter